MHKPPVPTANLKGDIRSFSWTLFSTSPRQLLDSPMPPPKADPALKEVLPKATAKLWFFSINPCILHGHHSPSTPTQAPPIALPPHDQANQWQTGNRAPPGPRSQYQEILWLELELSEPFYPTTITKEHPTCDTQNYSVQKKVPAPFSISLTNCSRVAAVTALPAIPVPLPALQRDGYANPIPANPAPANIM